LLSFGIPGSNSAAVLLGGLLIHGLLPGPRLFEQNGEVIAGLYLGSFVAILAQLVVGVLVLPLCIWLVNRPRPYLAGFIFALVLSGVYTVNMSLFDLALVLGAGLLGYFMRYFGYPLLPLVLGAVLGELVESNYRRSLVLSGGDHAIFLEDPIAVGLLVVAVLIVVGAFLREWWPLLARKKVSA
jgi:putative tricarboxylic transport membrane protein